MLTKSENDRLTQVVGDAPMAKLMREHCWIPFARAASLKVGQPPQRVRLFGDDFVAFRADDGRVGFVDERCPHRGVSLALARIEGCTLRCLYHGWRIDASGAVIDVPSEGMRSAEVAAKIPVNRYPTRDAGGLLWAYLGKNAVPEFPRLPFMDVPPEGRFLARTSVPCNWLQALEGGLDSAHVGWLHQSWFPAGGQVDRTKISATPVFKTKETNYGMRVAAIRALPDGTSYLRIGEYVLPFTVLLRTDRPTTLGREFSCTMMVPVDDETHLMFWCLWNPDGPLAELGYATGELDPDNYVPVNGTRANNWGQDRAAMDEGHYSGFTKMLLQEDVAAQVSMGPIADRTREHLCATDLAIAQTRRSLLRLLNTFEANESVVTVLNAYGAEGKLPFVGVISREFDWMDEAI